MPKNEHDTNPSTPVALQGGELPPDPEARKMTVRGLGGPAVPPAPAPGAAPPPAPASPLAVPASAPVGARKDSIEVLLDGIDGPPPDRTRQTPQSAGQASAAYHVEHAVRPATTTPDAEPKVMVMTAPMPATLRLDRARLDALAAAAPPSHRNYELDAETEIPAVAPGSGPSVPLRSAIALVAGLAVVAVMFAVLTRAPVAAPLPATAPPPPLPAATAAAPAVVAPASAAATAPAAPTATATATGASPGTATATAGTATPAPRPSATARPRPKPNPGDVGEFKTTFH